MNEDFKTNPMDRDQSPVWIENASGVKSCWPKHMAKEMVETNFGWAYAEADEVPTQKTFPIGMGELTPGGLQRRLAAQQSAEISKAVKAEVKKNEKEPEEGEMTEVRTRAKRAGISRYWVKSEKRLEKELAEKTV
jgi:hypothetical protein